MSVTLIRGLSGSGKSTLAKSFNHLHLEADMALIENGVYNWTPERVVAAHKWLYETFCFSVKRGMDVVVAGTMCKYRDVKPYVDFCKEHNVDYKIIRCMGEFQNVHNVPPEIIQSMKERYQDVEGEEFYYPTNNFVAQYDTEVEDIAKACATLKGLSKEDLQTKYKNYTVYYEP